MKKRLVAFGDSFVEGLIKDTSHPLVENEKKGNPTWHRHEINFATLIANDFDLEIKNYARRGQGNNYIASRVWDHFRQEDVSQDILLIVWSGFHRPIPYFTCEQEYWGNHNMYGHKYTMDEISIFGVMQLCKMAKVPYLMSNSFVDWHALENDEDTMKAKNIHNVETLFCSQKWFEPENYIEWGQSNNTLIDICAGTWNHKNPIVMRSPIREHSQMKIKNNDAIASCWHPNEKGHRLIADTLKPYIEKKLYEL